MSKKPTFKRKYSCTSVIMDVFRTAFDLNNNSNIPSMSTTGYRPRGKGHPRKRIVTIYGGWAGTNDFLCVKSIRTWRKLANDLGVEAGRALSYCGIIMHVQLIIKGGPNAPWACDPLNPNQPQFTLGWKATVDGEGPMNEYFLEYRTLVSQPRIKK